LISCLVSCWKIIGFYFVLCLCRWKNELENACSRVHPRVVWVNAMVSFVIACVTFHTTIIIKQIAKVSLFKNNFNAKLKKKRK
jgi:hypothetical protein